MPRRALIAPVPAEAELVLRLSLGSAQRSRDPVLARLVAEVPPEVVLGEARRHRLGLLLGRRLAAVRRGGVGAAAAADLVREHRAATAAALAQQHAADEALAILRAAGLGVTAIKGAALSERLHGDPALRPSSDVDLLVAPHDLHAARRAMLRAGHVDPGWDVSGAGGLPRMHYRLAPRSPAQPTIELHWRLHHADTGLGEEVLARSRGGIPDPLADLVILLLGHGRDGLLGLRAVADVAAWWEAHGRADVPERLDTVIERGGGAAPCLAAAVAAAVRLGALPPQCRPATAAVPRLAARLADWSLVSSAARVAVVVEVTELALARPVDLPATARSRFGSVSRGRRTRRVPGLFRVLAATARLARSLLRAGQAAPSLVRRAAAPLRGPVGAPSTTGGSPPDR